MKQLLIARIRMTLYAKVAQQKGHGFQKKGKENPEGMYVQDETLERPSRQNWNRGPRHKTASAS
jgi:hypothetical protein